MIRIAGAAELSRIQTNDPFMTRILSLYQSYSEGYDFVGFWVQESSGAPVSAISRYEDKFSLWLTDASDMEEIAAFLRFQGAGCFLYNAAYALDIPDGLPCIGGHVLEYTGEDYISELEIYEPDFKSLYALLQACESPIFRVPDQMMFLSELTHRRNKEKLHLAAAAVDGRLASSVITVSETDCAAILGAVATHPDYRRRGLYRELVRTLATRLRRGGRRVYVLSASEQNTRFYQHSGFVSIAEFKEMITV